jgi:prepilin-type N-terminal cleavage/methylation domain-containing protein
MWRKLRLANAASTHAPAGFTLVELLVVIGILAVLMALLTPVVFQARASSKNAAIKAEIDMLHMAIMNYKNEYGSFPPCVSANAVAHVRRIFPRWDSASYPLTTAPTPDTALTGWLSGYASNPLNPLGSPRNKLFDFDQTRVSGGKYFPAGKPGSPYIYIDKSQYGVTFGTYQSMAGFNTDTFQILCAGADETWNTDDDLSNFWKGTRKEYLDSL